MTTYSLTPEKVLTSEIPPMGTYDPPPEYLPEPCLQRGKTSPDSRSAQICADCTSSMKGSV
jgi:hypothetical protein